MPKRNTVTFRMRIRVYAGDRMLGPGKMELLARIASTGSLSASAKEMGMSYMRAWKLIQELNRKPERQMVEMSRGGTRGGAAKLTTLGKKVMTLYQNMERKSARAATPDGRKLARLLQ